MKIHVLCNDGSPIGVTMKDLWGEGNRGIGLGGSEYALLTMCEAWHNRGDEVVLFNSPMTENGSPFEQRHIYEFDSHCDRDVLIVFRSPNARAVVTNNCLKVWWSCDQYTTGSFREFADKVQKIVCISPFHSKYFSESYGINNSIIIDLPVRIQDIIDAGPVPKVPKKVIFTSVPERGLHALRGLWDEIAQKVPDVNLTITSDYRLWGVEERNAHHRQMWTGVPNVRFLGAVQRKQLIVEQLQSQVLAYPNIYDELFCISVAEAQCAGVYPITSNVGALTTTNMGKVLPGSPVAPPEFRRMFIDEVVNTLNGNEQTLFMKQCEVAFNATMRFHPDNVVKQWDEKVFAGG